MSRRVGALVNHNLRWGDLVSPRAVIEFTLGDAWHSLPTLLAMGGFFLAGVLILVIAKKILTFITLRGYSISYILYDRKKDPVTGKPYGYWMEMPKKHWASFLHLGITSLFLIGLIILGIFTAAIGSINIWSSPLATIGIGLIGTYVFGTGLQQVGSYYFVLWFGGLTYGEYWCLVGTSIEGRVSQITPFFIELESLDPKHQCARTYRVSMTTVLNGQWEHSYHKEEHEPHVSKQSLERPEINV